MELAHIRTFISLVRLGSYSGAAKRLKISQPAVTMRIRALENEMGVALINKKGTQISLTPAGKIFYSYALRINRTLQFGLNNFLSLTEKSIVLAGIPTLSTYILPEIYQHFTGEGNPFDLMVQTVELDEIVEAVLDQTVDLGMMLGEFTHPDLVKIPLYEEHFILALHPSHQLSFRKSINLHELKNVILIGYPPNSAENRMIENMFLDAKIEKKVSIISNDVITMKQMVIENVGVAFLPKIAVRRELAERKLITRPIDGQPPLQQMCQIIALRETVQQDKVIQWMNMLFAYLHSKNFLLSDQGVLR